MKPITQYQSEDGKIFSNEADCAKYEEILADAKKIYLPEFPKLSTFHSGHGYYQHNPQDVIKAREQFMEILLTHCSDYWRKLFVEGTIDSYIVARVVSEDSFLSALYPVLLRLLCTDELNREFGQLYFRTNPTEAELFEINGH